MAEATITRDTIDTRALEAKVSDVENGAVCVFVGQTRRQSRGQTVAYLEYDAYVPMAEKQMLLIAQQAEERWGVQVAIQHRLGRVGLGEASVVVAVGSKHRGEAFEACRWCMDTLKADVPIWKRETTPDGAFWIEGADAVPAAPSPPANSSP